MQLTRLVLILVAAWLISLGIVGPVFAAAGPHGSYIATTDACAACHETHTADSSRLLKANGARALCITCHNSGYSGSVYDPEGGQISGYGNSPAGPIKRTDEGGVAMSSHMLGSTLRPPGGAAATEALTCIACHDPHGTSNYRSFRTRVVWNGLNKTVSNFTATFSTSSGVSYLTGSVTACTACHEDYATRIGGTYSGGFRHRVNVTITTSSYFTNTAAPLEQDTPANRVVCLTCHFAHGTLITNTTSSGLAGFSSALKRFTDMGVCSGCHFNNWP